MITNNEELSPEILITKDAGSNKWVHRALIALIGIATLYACAMAWVGRDSWHVAVTRLTLPDLLTVIALVFVGFLLRAARWHYYIRVLQWDVPPWRSFSALVASIALTATPGKTGELVKAALLREYHPVSLSQGAGILLVERLGDLVAVLLLALAGLTAFTGVTSYGLAGSGGSSRSNIAGEATAIIEDGASAASQGNKTRSTLPAALKRVRGCSTFDAAVASGAWGVSSGGGLEQ